MFDKIETNPKDAFELGFSFVELFDRNLMTVIDQEFPCFKSPNKSNSKDKAKGVNTFNFGQMRVLEVKASGFTDGKKTSMPHRSLCNAVPCAKGLSLFRIRKSLAFSCCPACCLLAASTPKIKIESIIRIDYICIKQNIGS